MKKPLIFIALALVLLAAVFFWLRGKDEGPATFIELHGNVDIRQISLAFDGAGRVDSLKVEEGDAVKAGQVLALLDTRTLALQAAQAEAQIEVQQQTLQRLRNGARPQEVAQARSRLEAARADSVRAGLDESRMKEIGDSTGGRGVSAQDLDRAVSAARVARAKVVEMDEALRLLQAGSRNEDIEGAAAQLKAAQAQLALLQHQIAQGELKAPADAVVRSRLLETGDMATAQRPVFALALTDPKWVRVYVSEPDLGRIKPGMSAEVTSDSQPERKVAGTVGYISSVAEFTPKQVQTEDLRTSLVYEVRVRVTDANDSLRLGQPVTVRLVPDAAQ